ncbi:MULTISPECIES: TIGR03915 family putative DNA repair protein [unclassified Clostridium]|uniref:TIGR03915 family putative DNA repair protein n=1 Tax=unclassified Clostridium TaxID=2614128 RepID=UPI0018984F17|nr:MULTISPECIES: TIGR03915 family putative DNA repair protein [unclassified Clostridium]MBP3916135.1 TIGR03915 family putative DNA repair protein [Clostridium sp.]MEE0933144.1 TIGR03915 family putative DNA repair protein [Clostridium sp.]
MIEFLYDGSLEGLFTAIFYAYPYKDDCTINKPENHIPSLLNEIKEIPTESDKFKRVYNSIIQKLNGKVLNNVYYLYLSEIDGVENIILDYLKLCYKYGTNINLAKNNDTIILVDKYYKKVAQEAHMFTGFVRFKEIAPLSFYAQIEPVYNILPIILNHFTLRFSDQNFIIHDLKREKAIMYNKESSIITDLSKDEGYLLSNLNNDENFESLWKTFYKSVNIKERENSKLRNQHMPKRYWNHLTEI